MKGKTFSAVVIWMLLGSAILVNQVSQPMAKLQAQARVEQGEEDTQATGSHEQVYVVQDNLAINSFSQINLHQELYQIREIILDEVADPQHFYLVTDISGSSLFRTLFRQVISPNAP